MKKCADKPCPTCPWRKESKAGGGDIRGFSIQQMRDLSSTVPDRESDSDGFFSIMACHHSEEGEEYACAGYIAVQGLENINVRLLAAQGRIDLSKVLSNCEGLELYDSFYTMLDDYESAQHT
jgi:hypothetical protein